MTSEARPAGAPWLRLDARAGWRMGAGGGGVLADGDGLRLGLPGRRAIPDADSFGAFGGRKRVTGVAVAPEGRLFLADPAGRRILTYVPPDAARPPEPGAPHPFRTLWPARPLPAHEGCAAAAAPADPRPADPYALVEPRDVALAPNGDLLIADAGAGRVLVLIRPDMALRRVIDLGPAGRPMALGFDGAGRLYVADAGAGRVWRFAGGARDADHAGGPAGFRPEHLAVLPDGALFAVSGGRVVALDRHGRETAAALPDGPLAPPPLVLDGEALLAAAPPREALRLDGVAVDRSGRLSGGGPPLLARPRRVARPRSGVFLSAAMDGLADGFPWHRLTFALDLPERTRMVVRTLTADAPLEPSRVAALPPEAWSTPLALASGDIPETLIQSGGGRWLWLRLELYGDGAATPRIDAVEVFGPRDSGAAFLPPPFRQDPESAAFLDRFMSHFDTVLAEILESNRAFAARLDPWAAPAGPFLDWLGRWFDWRFMADWPEATRREMIAEAIPFFRSRGTVEGLRRMIRWHTGLPEPAPAIIEHFRLRGRAEPLWLGGVPLAPAPPAHAFTIALPASAAPDEAARAALERIIEAQKPAHTRAALRLIAPGMRVGRQALIGVDTLLGPDDGAPLGLGRLGQDLQTDRGAGDRLGAARLAWPC